MNMMDFVTTALDRIDAYKLGHKKMYPEGTTLVYNNFTPRSEKLSPILPHMRKHEVVVIGVQRFVKLLKTVWDTTFFNKPCEEVVGEWEEMIQSLAGAAKYNTEHIKALHQLGYLPLEIKAIREGTSVPFGIPVLTIKNTHPDFAWLPGFMEDFVSAELWKPMTTATIAKAYRDLMEKYAEITGGSKEFINWQGHDFSLRGMSGIEDAANTGVGHLLFFTGTDNVPAVKTVRRLYGKDFLYGSVPASEHSVMCAGGKETEADTFERMLDLYPESVVSLVSDTWGYWEVLTEIIPALKPKIMARKEDAYGNCKTVLRPDCYSEDTSILTSKGWKLFSQLTEDDLVAQVTDKNEYEFVKPLKIVNQQYSGEMHHFKDYFGKVDLLVTPNHRMVLKQNGEERIVAAEKMGAKGHNKQAMFRSAHATGSIDFLTDIERLKIAFQADGSFCTGTSSSIRFSFSKPRKIERLRSILHKVGCTFKEYNLKDGKVEFNIKLEASEFSKTFNWVDFENVSSGWAKDFLQELSNWDASVRNEGRFKFDTTAKEVIDVVELVAIAAGHGCLISEVEDNRKEHFLKVYTAHIMTDCTVGGQSWRHDKEHYHGRVYCVSVPTGKVIVKRNRCTMVCGNSGDPVKIICGDPEAAEGSPEQKGSVEVLWETFGGTINDQGYRTLDKHIGLIYGDSITLERCEAILEGLKNKGFASDNIVFGIGSFTYQYLTRDSNGFAMKATYIERNGVPKDIFKEPKTDGGTKKSAKGLLSVVQENGKLVLKQQCTKEEEQQGMLLPVFRDGDILIDEDFVTVRKRAGYMNM